MCQALRVCDGFIFTAALLGRTYYACPTKDTEVKYLA